MLNWVSKRCSKSCSCAGLNS